MQKTVDMAIRNRRKLYPYKDASSSATVIEEYPWVDWPWKGSKRLNLEEQKQAFTACVLHANDLEGEYTLHAGAAFPCKQAIGAATLILDAAGKTRTSRACTCACAAQF